MNEQEQFYEIYDIYITPWWKTQAFFISIAILTAALLGLALYFFVQHRKKKRALKLAAWDIALNSLKELTPEQYTTKQEFKSFYFTLTSTMKRYLATRYGWDIESVTDSKIEDYLHKRSFDAQLTKDVSGLFEGSLSVRFANIDALPAQARNDLARAYEIIQKTVQKPAK
jgi:hypothetical protein